MEPHRSTPRRAAALAIGSLTTLGLSLVQAAASVPGWLVGVVGVAALVAIPVSRELSRRVAMVLATSLGWAPVVWLVDWPTGELTRFGGVTAVLWGCLAGWVVTGPVRERAAALVPRVRGADAVALAGVAVVAAYLWPLLRLRSGPDVMGVVLGGWDHVGHFDMARMIVHGGRLIPFLTPGESGPWFYDSYPQGLHSSVAMVMELRQGVGGGSGIAEVAAYLQATTFVYAATLAMLVTGLCAMPVVRRRPLRAAWAVGALLVAWLVSPGGAILHQAGYDNFLLATAGVAVVPMLLTGRGRLALTGPMVAASGAVMAVAHNWVLLLPMASVATVAALWPPRGPRRSINGHGRLVAVGLGSVTLAGALAAVIQVLSARGADHLLVDGGFPTHNLAGYVVPIVGMLVLAVLIRGRLGWTMGGAHVVTGLVLVAAVGGMQMLRTGHIGYYGIKLLTAVMLLAFTTLVLLAVMRPALRMTSILPGASGAQPVRGWQERVSAMMAVGMVAGSVLVASVLPVARQRGDFPSLRVRAVWSAPPSADSIIQTATLERILAVPLGDRMAFFLPDAEQDSGTLAHLNLWQLAIRGAWRQRAESCWQSAWKVDSQPGAGWADRMDPVIAARAINRCGGGIVVVVPSPARDLVSESLPGVAVVGWVASP